jgi:hypothetical protein
MTTEELLRVWWGGLPFATLEKIHGIDLFGLNDEETEDALNECEDDWNSIELEEKEEIFVEHYEDNIEYTGEYEDLFKQLKNIHQ